VDAVKKPLSRRSLVIALGCALISSACFAQNSNPPSPAPLIRLVDTLHASSLTRPTVSASTLALESKAFKWSTYTTVGPVLAGIVIWKLQRPKHVYDYDMHGNWVLMYDKDPNRTLPAILICTGVIAGPSSGYFVAGCAGRGVTGILIRSGLAGVTVALAGAVASVRSDEFMDFSGVWEGVTVLALGATAIVFHSAYDLTHVKQVVERHEQQKLKAVVTVAPQFFGSVGAPGLELKVKF
jgi:hypothetical protein